MQKQTVELERIAGMSTEEAKRMLLEQLKSDLAQEQMQLIRENEAKIREDALEKSKEILKNMKNLNTIYLTNNKITDISILNNLINLRRLRITGEENKIDLSQIQDMLPNLELHISGKQLETVNFCTNKEKITKLTTYGLDNMPDISSLNNLKHIDIIESRIRDYSNLTKITSLETLYMYSSNLHEKRIEFSKLPNIKILNLSHNFLNDQDIQLLLANMENHINLNRL